MKYYIEYRKENGTTTLKTPLLTTDQIKAKFRELMTKNVVIESVWTEDHDEVMKPGPSDYNASRKFRLTYRKEGKTIIRYTHWASMNRTQNRFYSMFGDVVFMGIEEKIAKGAVPEAPVKKRGRPRKDDLEKYLREEKKEIEAHYAERQRLKKKYSKWLILLIMIGAGLLIFGMFLGALKSPTDIRQESVANDVSSDLSSETDIIEDDDIAAFLPLITIATSMVIIVLIVAMVVPMVSGRRGF